MKKIFVFGLLALAPVGWSADQVEALLVVTSDQHSSYERTAQFVQRVKQLRANYPAVPMAVLINGDTFEGGNVVAERSGGAIEYAMFAALARCAPTVLNVGNHEPEFAGLAETIRKIQETGVIVITNAVDHSTGQPFAPSTCQLRLGEQGITVVGLGTPHLATYRAAVRPSLDLPDPVAWAQKEFPNLLAPAELSVVMSHAGLAVDRALFPFLPRGAILVGGHDHLRLVERREAFIYFQSGSWNEIVSVARLRHGPRGTVWEVEQLPLSASDPADSELSALIARTMENCLRPAERESVGDTAFERSPSAAASFVVEALRQATQADAAIVAGTTFGAGLPQGPVSRYALNACVRFDGAIFAGEIEGAQLNQLLARTNQGTDTPFAERQGENLVSASSRARFEPGRSYRLATIDWVVKNRARYLPQVTTEFTEAPELKLKAVAIQALGRQVTATREGARDR